MKPRAREISPRVRKQEQRDAWAAKVLDGLDLAIAVVEGDGAITCANNAGRRVLAARNQPSVLRGVLRKTVEAIAADGQSKAGLVVQINGETPRWGGRGWLIAPAVVALAFQPEPAGSGDHSRLRAALGLTAPEARLALRVSRGCSNSEIATRFGLSLTAVKSRVRSLRQKLALPNRTAVARLVIQTLAASETSSPPTP